MDILKGLLGTVAPMVATALGGPVGGIAVKFLAGKLLGDETAPMEAIIEAVKGAPEAELKQLDDGFKLYQAENERLAIEQGRLTDTMLDKVDPKTASSVALLRMTTRPKVVLRMSHFLLAPLYIMAVDGFLAFINIWLVFFDHSKQLNLLAATFFSEGSVYATMYSTGAAPAATIVVSYMTLRQIEKSGNPFSGLLGLFKGR